ncbi:ABC transporter substrate-binding protein [Paroceanicella profunda]|uniref:ABC transporter substrate-binding protein n=1 Tax=Paroceanicella profunda TaxID=2579971 RepID=A0A5B8FXI8_9RHOB|nr:ABC transporter substrate-binding protein [Paroceanicella profunda]QDL91222.1 ABC transporter substrate-binding protein [Paroceanicella profunda]
MKTLFLAGAAAICLTGAAAQAEEIKVGSVGGVTGPIADIVAEIMEGRALAAAQVNAQGGLLKGDTMTLVLADSGCDPKAAVDAGSKVVNIEQVVGIVGPNCSGATNAMVQSVTIPAGVVTISESATAPSITALEDKDLVFRVAPSDAYQGVALAQYVLDSGVSNVAVTWANDDYNAGLGEVFVKAFQEKGGTIAASQVHEPNKASYRAEMATLGGAGGEALVMFAYYGSSGITLIRNALETGAFTRFFGADGMVDDEVINQIGAENLTEAAFTAAGADDSSPSWAAYIAAAQEAGLANPTGPFVPNGYDATFLMALAIEKAGSADRSLISAALREVANAPGEVILPGEWEKAKALIAEGKDINYQGASGEIEFDAAGDVAGVYSLNTPQADGSFKSVLLK